LDEDEAVEVRRSQLALTEAAGRAHSRREARLRERGLPQQQRSARLRTSLEMAARPRPYDAPEAIGPFAQDPTHYHYPGLPQIPFYERERFDWAPKIEAATAAVREELIGLLAGGKDELRPFRPSDEGLPLGVGKALRDGRNWGVLALCEQGWLDPDYIRRCPRTWETLLSHAPVPRVPGWGPSVIFSMLSAGAHIGAHTGMYNSRLICHLPLIVPPGCRFRVGDEVRDWEEGKLLIFDDTIEHEAWNDGPEDRVVLIFDIWRPELTEQEKLELTLLFSD
jgi:aspartyl/asparaginyl beta-hydroxylase (cupin superfamily)